MNVSIHKEWGRGDGYAQIIVLHITPISVSKFRATVYFSSGHDNKVKLFANLLCS